MYIPKPFKVVDAQITHAFIQSNPFATLTSTIENKIVATHLPIDCLQDSKYYGHFARNNPQANISPNEEVCVIFSGPHAYISPNMYVSDFNVPTWNYSAVHCYGNIKFIEDEAIIWQLFQEIVVRHEGEAGWQLPNEKNYKDMLKFIRLFEFEIKSIEAKFKWSQNKDKEDILSAINKLKDSGLHDAAACMAEANHLS